VLPKVEYSLTPLGQTLVSLPDDIRAWAETHIEAVLEAPDE
jgi:DNA-binding HxlR family transcriptional regulator